MRRIDAHCHFFNRKELSALMLLNIIHMIRHAEISLSGTNTNQNVNEARQISKSVKSSISFFMTSLKSPKQIYKKINSYEKGYIFAPLMLDAYWLTQSPKTDEPHVRQDDIMGVVKNELDNISDSLQNIAKRKTISTEKRHLSIETKRITDSFKRLLSKKTFEDVPKLNSSVDNFPLQETEITALQEAYPND
ncbi:MAG: hypothetical protein IKM57_00100, partial [Paludibacteraceae bacterium]|nr:hypothetical protein [Paludibacteraceae bacterium]